MTPPLASILADGRLHLQHGPIDLVIEAAGPKRDASPSPEGRAESAKPNRGGVAPPVAAPPRFEAALRLALPSGEGKARAAAYRAATVRFATILEELCAELPILLAPVRPGSSTPSGDVARRMDVAVRPYAAGTFITPMAAVAGAVAEEVLAAMIAAADLRRAAVNNGGDIALHLAPGESFRIGLVDRPEAPGLFGTSTIASGDGIGGIATSGWRGRSFSRGIADAVTILARSAAEADAAATIVANAVDLPGHPAVTRVKACEVRCDSDLGDILVTRAVGALARGEIEDALGRGHACARDLQARGLIRGAALHLQGVTVATGSNGRHAEEPFAERRLEARTSVLRASRRRPSGPAPQHDEVEDRHGKVA